MCTEHGSPSCPLAAVHQVSRVQSPKVNLKVSFPEVNAQHHEVLESLAVPQDE